MKNKWSGTIKIYHSILDIESSPYDQGMYNYRLAKWIGTYGSNKIEELILTWWQNF